MITGHAPDDVIVWLDGRGIAYSELLGRVNALAAALPPARHVVNICESRLAFLTGFLAAAQRGQVTLLPSNRAPFALAEIQAAYPDHSVLTDEAVSTAVRNAAPLSGPALTLPPEREVAIVFTSGSTGQPEGHAKHWRTLVETAQLTWNLLLPGMRYHMVATVPSQHMYGFETTVMLTLVSGGAVSDARPFFPRDICNALSAIPVPRVWVTTPTHLRACVSSQVTLPELALIVSATAALDAELAQAAERLWRAPVHEIYGCTEAGGLASRRTAQSAGWRTYPGAWIEQTEDQAWVHGRHLPAAVALQDRFALGSPTEFGLLGRSADLVKVAGKRASLAELTRCLLTVPGVTDGIVFVPQADGRTAALAVAPGLSREAIIENLAERIDAAFLPRPLVLVEALPRNEAGKLPRAALLAAIDPRGGHGNSQGHDSSYGPQEAFLDGHFPGNPVVPGVVILERVFEELQGRQPERLALRSVPVAKFLSPLRPEEPLTVETSSAGEATVKFRCHVHERAVAEGLMTFEILA